MNRGLSRRIRHLEALVRRGRHVGYGLAERVRTAANEMPPAEWRFVRDNAVVPYAVGRRAAHRQLDLFAERAPAAGHPAWREVTDILWYLDNQRFWRPRQAWDLLWRFARETVPQLPAGPAAAPTALLGDVNTALNTHDPRYTPAFRPRRRLTAGAAQPVTGDEYLPPSARRPAWTDAQRSEAIARAAAATAKKPAAAAGVVAARQRPAREKRPNPVVQFRPAMPRARPTRRAPLVRLRRPDGEIAPPE